ncbi:ArnT family glycosyltransferase [Parvularcula sp. LCG005]|uniref:ArnT family glycosyltransferase n=1 Tax=Parvularcula sp. LCG005 TaxID=3078805 RepID=UPI0029434CE1|nr:glycosyltransferase family 39 protein [Parvularcula sp. LCG005]WOI54051.1 glycosyltransferase family 39 protein [Parvularcula sp. LCG005]
MTADWLKTIRTGIEKGGWPVGLAIGVVLLLTFALFYDGIGPRDAERYILGARQWLDHGLYLGENHWQLRHPYVVPMAAIFGVFGVGNLQASLPNLIYAALLIWVSYRMTATRFDRITAFIFAILLATSAEFVILATEVRVFGPEVFFAVAGLWAFVKASSVPDGAMRSSSKWMIVSALACFGSWMCRESAAYLPMAIGLLSLLAIFRAQRMPWQALAVFCAAYWGCLALEALIYWSLTGDFLFRYRTDVGHGGGAPGTAPLEVSGPIFGFLSYPVTRQFTDPSTTPLLVCSLVLFSILAVRRRLPSAIRSWPVAVFGFASVMAFAFNAYALSLESPFYLPIFPYTVVLVAALLLRHLVGRYGPRLFAVALATVLVLQWAGADFRKYGEYEDARFIAQLARDTGRPVYTDALTMSRARNHLEYKAKTAPLAMTHVGWIGEMNLEGDCALAVITSAQRESGALPTDLFLQHLGTASPRPRRLTHRLAYGVDQWLGLPDRVSDIVAPHELDIYEIEGPEGRCDGAELAPFLSPTGEGADL